MMPGEDIPYMAPGGYGRGVSAQRRQMPKAKEAD